MWKINRQNSFIYSTVIWLVVATVSTSAVVASDDSIHDMQDLSLYQLESKWTDQDGRTVELKDLSGKIVVLAMAYTSCEYACPLIVSLMKRVEASLTKAQQDQVHFVLVSFDTKRDTALVLKSYRKKKDLVKNWTLLTGSVDDVRELAVLLGIKYKEVSEGMFSHSNVITIISTRGVILNQRVGLEQDVSSLSNLVAQAVEQRQ